MSTSNAANSMVDALIVGAGPVGLTAALEAKRLGLSVRIIERKLQRSTHDSRALVVHPRVMEMLTPHTTVVKQLQETGFQGNSINIHLNGNETVLSHAMKDTNWGDTDYPNITFIPQYDTEHILEEALAVDGSVKVEYGVSLEDFSQDDNSVVTAKLFDETTGRHETFTCQYVLGCDGGRSKTRELAGIDMQRAKSKIYFIIADLSFFDDSNSKPPPIPVEKSIHLYSHTDGIGALLPLPGKYCYRAVFQAPPGVTSADDLVMDEAFFRNLLYERTSGLHFDTVKLQRWQTVFEITHGIASAYRNRRIFLAGDAAHVHSPVGGQGMNYGMQDALNWAWKMAWAQRCSSAAQFDDSNNDNSDDKTAAAVEQILNSYETERHKLGSDLISTVELATTMVTTQNVLLRIVRNLAIRLAFWMKLPVENQRKLGQLELCYDPSSSAIILNNDNDDTQSSNFICKPGQRLPNLRLANGSSRLHHLLVDRKHHTWVFLNMDPPVLLSSNKAVSGTPSEEQVSAPKIAVAALQQPQVLLVRPDLFVAGVDTTYECLLDRFQQCLVNKESLETM